MDKRLLQASAAGLYFPVGVDHLGSLPNRAAEEAQRA